MHGAVFSFPTDYADETDYCYRKNNKNSCMGGKTRGAEVGGGVNGWKWLIFRG